MLFKDLKNGYPIYVFDRDKVEFTQSKVLDITPSHFDSHFGNPTEMVVDVTIEGFPKSYTFKDGTDVGYVGSIVISVEREKCLKEVEALKVQSEQALSKKDIYEANIDKCSKILSEFSPVFKERRETEERFSKLEGSVNELKNMIKGLVNELKS